MRVLNAGTLKSLFVPGGVLLLAVAGLVYSGWLTIALPTLTFLYYCALAGGALLTWRFHSSRVFLSLTVLFVAQQAAVVSAGKAPFVPATLQALAVLVPVNFVLIELMRERGFSLDSVGPVALFLFVQCLTVIVFCGAASRTRSLPLPFLLPKFALLVIAGTSVFFAIRFLLNRRPVDSALLWALIAVFLALRSAAMSRMSIAFWATSACILGMAVIENSYLLAYHDELTTLPSRRAFNEALQRLKSPYSIAVVDIDHFKRFNDTYGHDTGDQVLRMVAACLARVSGGGQAYRCGGEEFNIVFPGKTTAEIGSHLEKLRLAVQDSEFRLRGGDRRQVPRGPDRRNQKSPGRGRKKQGSTRPLADDRQPQALSVTISIGAATSAQEDTSPQEILELADKALYRAKANGRNRIETGTASPRRLGTKAAGIA